MSDKCEHGEWEDSCPCCLRYEMSMLAKQLEQANKELASARREGWEQGKRECENIANNLFKYESGYYHYREDVGDAIAAMEYGGSK